jgi:hypothetical protein
MRRMTDSKTGRIAAVLIGAAALLACGDGSGTGAEPGASGATAPVGSAAVKPVELPGLTFSVPEGWESIPPQSSMRVAEFNLPGSAGVASLTVFRFPGGAGTAQANVSRWVGQFQKPDGSSVQDSAKVDVQEREGLKLTTLDVSGNYGGQQMPGAPEQPAIQDARLLALVVEGSGDPYFFKLVGPAATVEQWSSGWQGMAGSMRAQ